MLNVDIFENTTEPAFSHVIERQDSEGIPYYGRSEPP